METPRTGFRGPEMSSWTWVWAPRHIGIEKQSWFLTIQDFERLSSMLPIGYLCGLLRPGGGGQGDQVPAELEYMKQAAGAAEAESGPVSKSVGWEPMRTRWPP